MLRLPVFCLKLLLVLACLAGALLSGERSRVIFLSATNPEGALAADPGFAPAALLYGEILLAKDPIGAVEKRIRLARAALRDEPLSAAAVRQIGLARDRGAVAVENRPLMRLADRMSRRDGLTQLWLAQDRVKAGEVFSAVAHIDTVMRVHERARDQVFPLLVKIMAGPGIATALAARSDAGADWIEAYLNYYFAKNGDRKIIAKILMAIENPLRLRDADGLAKETIRELAIAGEGETARALFEKSKASGIFKRGGSAKAIPWRVFDQPAAVADVRNVKGRLVIDILAEKMARATVAQQIRFDTSGAIRWVPRLSTAVMPAGSQILLKVQCAPGETGVVIWSAVGHPSGKTPVTKSSDAILPRHCPAAVYAIEVAGPRESEPLMASLADIEAPGGEPAR